MSEPSPEGNRPQKSKAPTPSRSKPSTKSKSSSKTTSGGKKSRPRTRAAKKPRARKRGERRSRVRLRRVVPGTTYFLTKKTNDDQFFLRPDGSVDAVLLYLLIEKLNKYGLLLHEFVFMSNHFHFVVTDPRGRLPDFMREFVGESGKALKIVLQTTRRIWSPTPYSSINLLDLDSAERFMVYARVNPTEAGLTEPGDWPGLTSARWKYGDTIVAERPEGYFNAERRADRVSCVLEPLPVPELFGAAVEDSGAIVRGEPEAEEADEAELAQERKKYRRRCAALQKKIDRSTAERVTEILEKRKRSSDPKSRGLAGATKVKNASRQKRGNHHYGRLNPRFASKDHERLFAAIEEERSFRASHEQARLRYLNGEQGVLFPVGTYGYRELLGVRVRKVGAAA